MSVTTHDQIVEHVDDLVPLIQRGLCDTDARVRKTTAETFAQLHICIGNEAVETILPQLLKNLDDPDTKEDALDGLRQIMSQNSKVVLPFLVPRLTTPPLTVDNARALGTLASVAGADLNRYLPDITTRFLDALGSDALENPQAVQDAAEEMVLSLDEEGLQSCLNELSQVAQEGEAGLRRVAISLLGAVARKSEHAADEEVLYDLIESLLLAFCDPAEEVVQEAWGGLTSAVERITTGTAGYLDHIMSVLKEMDTRVGGGEVPGFCIPKGLQPVFPLVHSTLLQGTTEAKATAAKATVQLVNMTSAKALAPFILKLTGGLIRATSDNSGSTKAAMLGGIHAMLLKVPAKLKSMLPQLQPMCVKSLQDTDREVRQGACDVLDQLMPMQRRIDPLLKKLVAELGAADEMFWSGYLAAIWSACDKGKDRITDEVKDEVLEAVRAFLDSDAGVIKEWAGKITAVFE
jgi:hypothetical protein